MHLIDRALRIELMNLAPDRTVAWTLAGAKEEQAARQDATEQALAALNESDAAVDTLALRFCTSKAMSELMACAASGVQGFADRVRSAHSQILKMTEQAMTLSIKGDPQGTVMKLLEDGERTLNAKLIESAHQVLQRYNVRIADHEALAERTHALRERYRTSAQHSRLGEHTGAVATPGGVSLPAGYKPPGAAGLPVSAA